MNVALALEVKKRVLARVVAKAIDRCIELNA